MLVWIMVDLRNSEFFGPIWRRKFIVHSEDTAKVETFAVTFKFDFIFREYLSSKDLFMIQFIET